MQWNSGRVCAPNLGSFGAEAQEMKGGFFLGFHVVPPAAGTELGLLLLLEPPFHGREFSWSHFLGLCLAFAKVEH